MSRAGRQVAARLAAYAALAVGLTWPLATAPAALAAGGLRSDVYNSLWSFWFMAQGLARGEVPLFTTLLNHPEGGRLLIADPLNAALAAPLTLAFGPTAAYAATVLAHVALSGFFADALGRRLGGNGWLAGVAYAASPIVLSHLQNGSSEAVAVAWLPLAGLAMERAAARPSFGRVLLGALALAAGAIGGGWYAGVDAFLLGGALLFTHRRGWRAAPALLLGAALVIPYAHFVQQMALAPDGLLDIKDPEIVARLRRTVGAADPRAFLMPGDFRVPDFRRLEQNPSDLLHTTYLGWVVLVAAAWKGRKPALWLAALAACLLAMGPSLVVGGGPVAFMGRALPLPYVALEGLPGFASLSLVYRLATLAPLALGLLADRAPAWLAPLALLEALLLSPARGLPEVSPANLPKPALALAAEPPGAVISLPSGYARTRLFDQVAHGNALTASVNSGMNAAGLRVLADLRDVARSEGDWTDAVARAQSLGVRYVIVHEGVAIEATFATSVRALKERGRLVASDDTQRVYAIW